MSNVTRKRKRSKDEESDSHKKARTEEIPEFRLVTVRQPWAEALLKGIKKIENRTYPVPPWLFDRWCALHVSSNYGKFEKSIQKWPGRSSDNKLEKTCGKIIGLIQFSASVDSKTAKEIDPHFTDFPVKVKHHWVVKKTIPLSKMIPTLSNVRFPRVTNIKIRKQLGAVLQQHGETQKWIPIPKEGDKHFCIHCGLSYSKKATLKKHVKSQCEYTGPIGPKRQAIASAFLTKFS